MLSSYKTTIIGFVCGVLILVLPSMQAGEWPTLIQWCTAATVTFLGLFSKDHDKTGSGKKE